MQLMDAVQDFMLECKVRRLMPRTIDNYGKHLRYRTDYLMAEHANSANSEKILEA